MFIFLSFLYVFRFGYGDREGGVGFDFFFCYLLLME